MRSVTGTMHCTIAIRATVIGGLPPFRPVTSQADPATETIDFVLRPIYVVGRFLPPMSDIGSLVFFILVLAVNATLYGWVAHYLLGKFSTIEQPRPKTQ